MRACLWPQSGLRAAFAGREAPATCRSWQCSHCHPRVARALPRPQCLPARRSWRRPWFCSPCASGAWTPGLHLSAGRPARAGACAGAQQCAGPSAGAFCSLSCCYCSLRHSILQFSGDLSAEPVGWGAAAAAVAAAAAAATVTSAAVASVPVPVEGAGAASASGAAASAAAAAMAATGEGLRSRSSASRSRGHWGLAGAPVSAGAHETSCVTFQSMHVKPPNPFLCSPLFALGRLLGW